MSQEQQTFAGIMVTTEKIKKIWLTSVPISRLIDGFRMAVILEKGAFRNAR